MAKSPSRSRNKSENIPNPSPKDPKNKTFGNEPEVNDPKPSQQPDQYEVEGISESTPRREDMH